MPNLLSVSMSTEALGSGSPRQWHAHKKEKALVSVLVFLVQIFPHGQFQTAKVKSVDTVWETENSVVIPLSCARALDPTLFSPGHSGPL
jgi:hypothetical protein